MNDVNKDSEPSVQFVNHALEDKEWSAHIHLLNTWTTPDRLLRAIIQYARSGPFYPAAMHVDLIQQWHTSTINQACLEAQRKLVAGAYIDQDEIYFKFSGGFAAQDEFLRQLKSKEGKDE